MELRDRIIVALDANTLEEVELFVGVLCSYVSCFKVGLELISSIGGPQAIKFIKSLGGEVFYDGKFDDIPNTVGGASKAVSSLGVKMFNVHASAGYRAMRSAVENKGDALVLAVTVLTSLDGKDVDMIFNHKNVENAVLTLAFEAKRAGVDGIICSPQELNYLNSFSQLSSLLKVTPGIRPEWARKNDHSRIMTPYEAIKNGANMLVVGRPITKPPSPQVWNSLQAVKLVRNEIEMALEEVEQ